MIAYRFCSPCTISKMWSCMMAHSGHNRPFWAAVGLNWPRLMLLCLVNRLWWLHWWFWDALGHFWGTMGTFGFIPCTFGYMMAGGGLWGGGGWGGGWGFYYLFFLKKKITSFYANFDPLLWHFVAILPTLGYLTPFGSILPYFGLFWHIGTHVIRAQHYLNSGKPVMLG